MPQENDAFPVVAHAEGTVGDDSHVLIDLRTIDGGPLRFALKIDDLHDFVTLLLRLVADRAGRNPSAPPVCQPIPITGVSAGELEDGNGCLAVTIGGGELVFEMPSAALSEIGRMLMATSAPQVSA